MKTPSDDLFTLIKSLDTQEKVFFKVYSKNKGVKKGSLDYLKLFDAIDKLKTYDESLLKARLKKTGLGHNLKSTKSYLIEAISDSLRQYHSDLSVNMQLQKLLDVVELFIAKKLLKLAKKILLKAEKLALEHEKYDYLMVIYSFKKSLSFSYDNIKDINDYLNQDAPKEKQYLERLKNTIEFGALASQIRAVSSNSAKTQERKNIDKINSIINSPLLTSPDKALTFSSLQCYYMIHLCCADLLDTWDNETYERQKEWIAHLESNKKNFGYNTFTYLISLGNLMLIQQKIGRLDESDQLYEKTKQFYCTLSSKKRTKNLSASFAICVFNSVEIQIERGNPEIALKAWEEIKGFISFNTLDPSAWIHGYNNLSKMYFMLGNYHYALKFINTILDFKEQNMLDVQAMARIYLLLIHYEIGNYDMLPYLAKSSKRFLVKHHCLTPFAKIMIRFFENKVHAIGNKQKKNEIFRQLKRQFETLVGDAQKKSVLAYFDYISWIGSKIENRSFMEVLRRKR